MDTACDIRIKFTPLLQKNLKNNSKCCLEIVPEVSCIQNLDKLTWRQETNFIEYTIPMTYKIILKKRQAIKNSSDDQLIKTYHSCVDLLLSSSKSTANFGSGDISKIISDTFILSKNVANGTSREMITNCLTEYRKVSNVKCNYPVCNKTTNTLIVESTETDANVKDDKVKVQFDIDQNIERAIIDKSSLDKLTNTENASIPTTIFNEAVQCGNAIVHVVPEQPRIKPEPRRLTLSPICSISTQETPLINKDVVSKATTCKIYDSQKDLARLDSISTPSDLASNENQTVNQDLSTIIDIPDQRSTKRLRSNCRIPPELRIAKYLEYMEREVLPLKMMHNEILCKCASLGITFSQKPSKQSLMYKSISAYSCPNVVKSEDATKSNRVVYSIVFDDN